MKYRLIVLLIFKFCNLHCSLSIILITHVGVAVKIESWQIQMNSVLCSLLYIFLYIAVNAEFGLNAQNLEEDPQPQTTDTSLHFWHNADVTVYTPLYYTLVHSRNSINIFTLCNK